MIYSDNNIIGLTFKAAYIYIILSVNKEKKTCHLKGVNHSFNDKKYSLEYTLRNLNNGIWAPIKQEEAIYDIFT